MAKGQLNNPLNKHAVKEVKGNEMVFHLPRKFSWIAWYVVARSGEYSVEVISLRLHCMQLCGGMEILSQLELNCSIKVHMKRLNY